MAKNDFIFKKGVYIFSCHGLNPRGYLEKAGYKKHRYADEYILDRGNNQRFHAYIEDFKIHLHHDYVNNGWKHYLKTTPKEITRIEMCRILNAFKFK